MDESSSSLPFAETHASSDQMRHTAALFSHLFPRKDDELGYLKITLTATAMGAIIASGRGLFLASVAKQVSFGHAFRVGFITTARLYIPAFVLAGNFDLFSSRTGRTQTRTDEYDLP
eukprot:TRINITY_DN6796_c0_g1_i1.p1 TRINITY_DN6796_c0_g1~~TRINITY_DN6796_c0_g1_i1.p1  ORF type:complete len:117 (+),score=15.06 TRINITY_DN6796_c0_g1_i1:162-512(+)